MKHFWSILKKYPEIITALSIVLLIVVNNPFGKIIWGLDNISPFFGIQLLIKRIALDYNFFVSGPLLFSPFIVIGNLCNIPPEVLSQINSWLCFFMGVSGYFFIASDLIHRHKEKFSYFTAMIFVLFVIDSLATTWIFSQTMLVYVISFAAIPWVIRFLSRPYKTISKTTGAISLIALLLFFSVSLNLVAFSLFFIQAIILGIALREDTVSTREVLLKSLLMGVLFLVMTQLFMFLTGHTTFVFNEAWNLLSNITQHPYTIQITKDLQTAEQENNGLINNARFATGWLFLNGPQGMATPLAQQYLSNIVFVIAELIPIAFIIISFIRTPKKSKYISLLITFWLIAIFITSSYITPFIVSLPIIGSIFRFISSKVYPILTVPYILLLVYYVNNSINIVLAKSDLLQKRLHLFLTGSIIFCLLLNALPWVTGTIISAYATSKLPAEYQDISKTVQTQDLVYYPIPSRLYFRSYSWGYYGSEFISYISTQNIIDGGSLSPNIAKYTEITTALTSCKNYKSLLSDKTVVFDTYATTEEIDSQIHACLIQNFEQKTIGGLEIFTLHQ